MILLLTQFLYRLSFGMAAAMAITPPRLVTSGYYRNNLYVLLGLNALATLIAWGAATSVGPLPLVPAVGAVIFSYFGAACWLYEKPRAGIAMLVVVALLTLYGTLATAQPEAGPTGAESWTSSIGLLNNLAAVSSGLLLGTTMAAMLLGHWYLNAPGMRLQPLVRLTAYMGVSLAARTIVCGIGLVALFSVNSSSDAGSVEVLGSAQKFMLILRWLAGIFGTAGLIGMTWSTLKIPNTQAATGMLYVAVITTFLGELIGQLLSAGFPYPL